MRIDDARVIDEGRAVELSIDGRPSRFHAIWLRDNALDAATRSPSNGQRLITLLDIPADTRVTRASVMNGELALFFAPDEREVSFPSEWLFERSYDRERSQARGWTGPEITRWDAGFLTQAPSVRYGHAVT